MKTGKDREMCGTINNYQENKVEAYHSWTYAGDPNYFPYKGQVCDCGLTRYGEQKEIHDLPQKGVSTMNIRDEIEKIVEGISTYRKQSPQFTLAVDAIMKVVEKEMKDIKDDNKLLTAFFVEVGKSILQNPSIADIRKKLGE